MKRLSQFILVGLALLVPGLAWALPGDVDFSTYDLFTPTLTDKSVSYLSQIFGNVGGVLHGTSGQLLSELFGVFNYAMVAIAGALLGYTVLLSIVNTAQEGEFMGKKMNSAWVMFRAAGGIGIMVPQYTGYSLVQVIVMWVAVQGVGLGDKAWTRALEYLGNEGGSVFVVPGSTAGGSDMKKTVEFVSDVLRSEVCTYKLQAIKEASSGKAATEYKPNGFWNDDLKKVSFGSDDNKDECGSFAWKTESTGSVDTATFEKYKKAGLQMVVGELQPVAKAIVKASGGGDEEGSGEVLTTPTEQKILLDRTTRAIVGATLDYENIIQPALHQAKASAEESWDDNLRKARDDGWIVAGSYYWELSKINNALNETVTNYQPTVKPARSPATGTGPDDQSISKEDKGLTKAYDTMDTYAKTDIITSLLAVINGKVSSTQWSSIMDNIVAKMDDPEAVNTYLEQLVSATTAASGNVSSDEYSAFSADDANKLQAILGTATAAAAYTAITVPGVGIPITIFTAHVLAWSILWFNTVNSGDKDPMAAIQQLGQGMLVMALTLWILTMLSVGVIVGIGAMGSSVQGLGYAMDAALKFYMPIVMAFILALFVNGMVLSIYVPLIPMLIFTFAAIGWLVSVLEAMVAAPLVALGVTHPEGHDLLGRAEQAMILLLGVFMRPVVMVIGFLASMIILRVALRMLNAAFQHTTGAANITMSGWNIFGTAGLMIIYTTLVVSLINMVFNAGVVKLWENLWVWIGGQHQQATISADQAMQESKGALQGASQKFGEVSQSASSAGGELGGKMASDSAQKNQEAAKAKKQGASSPVTGTQTP